MQEEQTTEVQATDTSAQGVPETDTQEQNTGQDTSTEQTQETEASSESADSTTDETEGEQQVEENQPKEADNNQQDNEQNRTAEQSRKEHNARMAQQRIAARNQNDPFINELKQQAEAQVAEIENDYERRIAAMEYREQINTINQVRNTLVAENNEVRSSIDYFNPADAKYVGDDVYQDLIEDFDRVHTVKDQDGNIYDAKDSLFDFMAREAQKIERYTTSGQRTGQRNEQKLQHTAITPPATNTQSGDDNLDDRVQNYKF